MNTYARIGIIVLTLALTLSALGCSVPPPTKPVVSIGSPAHGAQVNAGQEVLIQASAADANGVVRIELWVNGQLHSVAQPPSPQVSHAAVLRWTPASAGTYTLVAKAVNVGGLTSEPAAVAVNVVGEVTPTPTPPISASVTVAPKPTATKTATVPAACIDDAAFVEDVTVPDGTNWAPGQAFNKIWRVRNTGTCAWGPGDEFVFVGGEAMTTQSTFVVPVTAPGATADLFVAMLAPATPGSHAGQWRLRNSKSGLYGATLTVKINVLGSSSSQGSPPAPGSSCAGAPAIVSFSANPTTLTAGQSSTLSWGKVDNADSAAIDQGIGGVATPGSTNVKPDKTTTYTLTATGCGGTATKQVTVTVTLTNVGIIDTTKPLVLPADLAVTKMYLLTTTGPSRVHVDVKNTGGSDFNGSFHYVCYAVSVLRSNPSIVATLVDEGNITRKIPNGATEFFNPLIDFDARTYMYSPVTCAVTMDGDLTPNDNTMTTAFP